MEPLHASAEQLRAFLKHESSPEELIAIGDHLADCAECRSLATAPGMGGQLEQALAGQDHLTYEELEELASGAAIPEHIQHCALCASELDDLRKFRAALEAKARPARTPARVRWGWAAAVLAAGLVIAVVTRTTDRPKPPVPQEDPEVAQVLQSGQLP